MLDILIKTHIIANITSEGLTIAIVGYLIIFTALILLSILFLYMPKIINLPKKLRQKKSQDSRDTSKEEDISGEVNAAIATALYLYFNELHDEESRIMTIQKVSRRYSPWSSKIYNVSQNQLFKSFK